MPSRTEVANLALAMVGDERVASLDTDTSKPARLCNEMLPQVVDLCLVAHPWNFAVRRAAGIPALTTTPAWGFAYAYEVPAGCLRVLGLNQPDPHEPWHREGNILMCDVPAPIGIRYISRVTDSGAWSPHFVDLVAATLAQRLALPLSASQQNRATIAQLVAQARSDARAVDAAEGTPWPQYAPAEIYLNSRY